MTETNQEHDVETVKKTLNKIGPEWIDETVEKLIGLGEMNLDGKPRLLKVKVRINEVRDEILCNNYKINVSVQDPHK